MIVVIDYGMGNLHSVMNALHHIGCEAMISQDPSDILRADKLILPGVGAFPDCMENLRQKGLIEVILEAVQVRKIPLLGICLGMQALFEESEEGGRCTKGLGLLQGRIIKMQDPNVKIPHIGWNLLEEKQFHTLFSRMSERPFMYYVHSYYASFVNERDVYGVSYYGDICIPGLVAHANVSGAQFHPEKSGEDGLTILRWFKEDVV